MERLRQRIEQTVHSLTGSSLGVLDLDQPIGDPGLFGPESMVWEIHSDFTSMMVGGVSALLVQMLHPLALAGVWDHSSFRHDMLGRLRRTSLFIAATSYGGRHDALQIIEKVRHIHSHVTGTSPSGQTYTASDPHLLTWVHVSEVSQFLTAYLRYCNPQLSGHQQDQYFDEAAEIALRLGARDVPRSRQDIARYLQRMQPELSCDARTHEVLRLLLNAPMPSLLAKPFGKLVMHAGLDLLPNWGAQLLNVKTPAWQRPVITHSVHGTAHLLRWAVRNSAAQRARTRTASAAN